MVGWRGPMHPRAGGAERYTVLALRGLVGRGVRVSWLVPEVLGLPARAALDGIAIVRAGRGAGHLVKAAAYLRRHAAEIDLVIDQVNGYPMFTQLAYRGPRLVLVHQLARGVWFQHLPWPAAAVGWALEPVLLAATARSPAVTVSNDTAEDLRRLGFRDVTVVPNAIEAPPGLQRPTGDRTARVPPTAPAFVALGRLVPGKRFEHVLDAFGAVRAQLPDATLTVVGRGEGRYVQRLRCRCDATPGVTLLANADEAVKWRALASATALVATSVREGWGLMISEAHAVGTPTVAYDVPGLRESTRHGSDGLVVPPRPAAAAEAMLLLAEDPALWTRMSCAAALRAAELSPRRLEAAFADRVEALLGREVSEAGSPRP